MIEDRIEVNIAGGLDVPLPRMIHVRQKFPTPKLDDVAATVVNEFKKPEVRNKIKPGMTIAATTASLNGAFIPLLWLESADERSLGGNTCRPSLS